MLFASSHRSLFKALRDDTDWFPHLDFEDPIEIGQVGTYDGKRCEFTWLHSLAKFGIAAPNVETRSAPPRVDRLFTHGVETTYSFSGGNGNVGAADFTFGSSGAIATQSIGQTSQKCDIFALEKAISEYINSGHSWSRDWVVVTQVFPAESFTILHSKSRRGSTTIRTGIPVSGSVFSIADTKLQLAASAVKGEVRHSIARQGVVPFFRIHKMKGWPVKSTSRFSPKEKPRLEPYGRDR